MSVHTDKGLSDRVLCALRAKEPLSRSEIVRAVDARGDTLERALERVLADGHARKEWVPSPKAGEWDRVVWWLTPAGRARADELGAEGESPVKVAEVKQGRLF